MGGLYDWPDYRALFDKAERDLASVQAHDEHPLDVVTTCSSDPASGSAHASRTWR